MLGEVSGGAVCMCVCVCCESVCPLARVAISASQLDGFTISAESEGASPVQRWDHSLSEIIGLCAQQCSGYGLGVAYGRTDELDGPMFSPVSLIVVICLEKNWVQFISSFTTVS